VLLFDRTRKYWRWWILVRQTDRPQNTVPKPVSVGVTGLYV